MSTFTSVLSLVVTSSVLASAKLMPLIVVPAPVIVMFVPMVFDA